MHLINQSDWPTPALRVIARWVCREAGCPTKYTVQVRRSRTNWYGRGWRHRQIIWMPRRLRILSGAQVGDPRDRVRTRTVVVRSRLDVLVWLLAHEAKHTRVSGDLEAERICSNFACDVVERFQKAWPVIRGDIKKSCRIDRDRRLIHEVAVCHPEQKRLEVAEARLAVWERKMKLARTKIRKYKRRVAYYQRRAAAVHSS